MRRVDMIPETSTLVPDELKKQIQPLFSTMTQKIKLTAVLDMENERSLELGSFLKAIVSCTDKVEL